MIPALISFLIFCLVVALIAGLVYYLIQAAPFLGDPWKPVMLWCVLAIAILLIVLHALPLMGVAL